MLKVIKESISDNKIKVTKTKHTISQGSRKEGLGVSFLSCKSKGVQPPALRRYHRSERLYLENTKYFISHGNSYGGGTWLPKQEGSVPK